MHTTLLAGSTVAHAVEASSANYYRILRRPHLSSRLRIEAVPCSGRFDLYASASQIRWVHAQPHVAGFD